MGSGVRLRAGKDRHPCKARPKTVPFSLVLSFYDDNDLLFYFHMKVNGHEILVSTNTTKLPRILSRWFKSTCYTSRFLRKDTKHYFNLSLENSIHLPLFLGKLISTILKKRLVIYQGIPSKRSRIPFKNMIFILYYSERKIVDFFGTQALKFAFLENNLNTQNIFNGYLSFCLKIFREYYRKR